MKVPPWCKPAFWGAVVGAAGIMILGFAWWGWVLGSTAEQMAEFQRSASWQHSQLIEKGGWATVDGSKEPNKAVARMCAQQLVNRKA
jgi:hypothetical protein